ncbi:MAG: hypothetical protein V5A56_14550 [Halolamina sp.]
MSHSPAEVQRCSETQLEEALGATITFVATLERREVDRVSSFDDDFDGVAPRLDPHDL